MSARAQQDPEILAQAKRRQPLSGGILEPRDLTGAALFLLSEDARMITGQVLDVDGGWSVG
jgi:NAD(P)-dependent dehydrogenase (short-subunit alcohol dehydrogenase family)